MKKLLVPILFLFITTTNSYSSNYEWQQILKVGDGNIFFIDKNSILKKGDNVFFIKMREFPELNEHGEKSSIIHHEADCKNFKYKNLTDFYFKLSMGKGEPSFIDNKESEWVVVSKDQSSLGKFLIDYVCNQ